MIGHNNISQLKLDMQRRDNSKTQVPKAKRTVVPIKLSKDNENKERKNWKKRQFAVFMKSVTILNQGLNQIKNCTSEDAANEIIANTYVKVNENMIDTVEKEHKTDLSDKIISQMVQNSGFEHSMSLASKRRRTNVV